MKEREGCSKPPAQVYMFTIQVHKLHKPKNFNVFKGLACAPTAQAFCTTAQAL